MHLPCTECFTSATGNCITELWESDWGRGEAGVQRKKISYCLHSRHLLVEDRLLVSPFIKKEEKWEYLEHFVLSLTVPHKCSWMLGLCQVSVHFWFAAL